MKITITHAPDFDAIGYAYRHEIGKGLVDVARFIIRDAVGRIAKRLTPSGGRQRPNSVKYAEWKYRHYGWRTPLKKDQILNDYGAYTINGRSPHSQDIEPRGEHLEVEVRLPREREDIVPMLRAKGYQYWELSKEDEAYERERMREALRNAKQAAAQLRASARRRGR